MQYKIKTTIYKEKISGTQEMIIQKTEEKFKISPFKLLRKIFKTRTHNEDVKGVKRNGKASFPYFTKW